MPVAGLKSSGLRRAPQVVVAGHICLDIIPAWEFNVSASLFKPGKLLKVGPAKIATGGAVSNVGIALHRLGVSARLLGKVGDDWVGQVILGLLRGVKPSLAKDMIIARGEPSSYTVVVNPPGLDRMFLHCPGANDTFSADDVRDKHLAGAKLFHFGYPPIMRRMYLDGGRELLALFRRVKEHGLMTSLDMVMTDRRSEAAKVNWASVLKRVMPFVDVFLPSLDEMRMVFGSRAAPGEVCRHLRKWGPGIVGLKLGSRGLHMSWGKREWREPCFNVKVAGTTGAGDCTIAGLLAGLLRGLPPAEVTRTAVAVGACSCEAADATSGVLSWGETQKRIQSGWKRRKTK